MNRIKSYIDFINEGVPTNSEDLEKNKVATSFGENVRNSQKAEESPRGSNKGDLIKSMQTAVGTTPGNPWCAAFIYDILSKVGINSESKSKIPNTASVKDHWEKSKGKKITPEEFRKNPSMIKPGMAFFYLTKSSKGDYPGPGHTGIILRNNPQEKTFTSVEGNTNPLDGAREGYGSFLVTRSIDDPSISKDKNDHPAKFLGLIDYFSDYRGTYFDKKIQAEAEKIISDLLKPKTEKEKTYLQNNPSAFKEYEKNYKERNTK